MASIFFAVSFIKKLFDGVVDGKLAGHCPATANEASDFDI